MAKKKASKKEAKTSTRKEDTAARELAKVQKGQVRARRNLGKEIPEGTVLDADDVPKGYRTPYHLASVEE